MANIHRRLTAGAAPVGIFATSAAGNHSDRNQPIRDARSGAVPVAGNRLSDRVSGRIGGSAAVATQLCPISHGELLLV